MKISVILLADCASDVHPLLAELSRQGMLHPCLVVEADGAEYVLNEHGSNPVALREYLAGRAIEMVRVICLSLSGTPLTGQQTAIVAQLDQALSPVNIRVEKGSIVVPLAGTTVSQDAFMPYWNYNFLVEPKDMAGEDRFAPVDLTSPEKQVAVATATVSLCGGLWKWLDQSPIDNGRFRFTGEEESAAPYDGAQDNVRIRFLRTTTRMVDAGDVTTQAIMRAVGTGVQYPPPEGCLRHGDARVAVNEAVAQMVPPSGSSALGFCYTPRQLPPPPVQKRISPWEAIKRFFSELFTELRALPREMIEAQIDRLKLRVEGMVTSMTYGQDSVLKVSFSGEEATDVALDPARRAEAVSALPDVDPAPTSPSPQTWTGLSAIVLSMFDGAELTHDFGVRPVTWDGNRAVLTDPAALAHASLASDSRGELALSADELAALGVDPELGERAVSGTNAAGAEILLTSIDSRINPVATPVALPADQLVATPAAGAADAPDPSTAVTDLPPPVVIDEPTRATLTSLRDRIKEWRDERSETLVWKLASSIARQQDLAFRDLQSGSAELQELLKEIASFAELNRASRKRFLRKALLLVAFISLILSVFFVGWLVITAVSVLIWWICLVIGSLGFLVGMVLTARDRVRFKNRQRFLEERPHELMAKRQQAANEYRRLTSLYIQLQDWAEILALAVHRPLGSVRHESLTPWTTSVGALSFVSGKPTISEERNRKVTLTVAQYIASRGWLTKAFQHQRSFLLEEYASIAGGVAATNTTPEADNTTAQGVLARLPAQGESEELVILNPRSHFRRQFALGHAAHAYRRDQVAALEQAINIDGPTTLIASIECDVPGLTNPPRDAKEFLLPIVNWTKVPEFSEWLKPELRMSRLQTFSVVGASSELLDAPLAKIGTQMSLEPVDGRLTLASFRVDVSAAVRSADVPMCQPNIGIAGTAVTVEASDAPDEPEFG